VGFLPPPGSHRGRYQCSLPEFSYDEASRDGRNVARSRWYRQVYRPCLDRVQNRSNKIASDVTSKLNQRRLPGVSVEIWHVAHTLAYTLATGQNVARSL
jgi:hypothetical protein